MNDLTDSDLLKRWITGDREAFTVLAIRHHACVTAACRRQAPSGDVEDCVQAVFLLLMRKPGAAARSPVLAAWLLRVAYFVCRTAQRQAERRRRTEKVVANNQLQEPAPQHQALEHLDECLMKLPDRQRTAVSLHYLAGKPADEVAVILGVTRDHAYQLICRGLGALRTRLAQRGFPVGTAVLVSLFATEAQAATPPLLSTPLFSLPSAPTPGVESLAIGALRTMTISSLTPLATAAGLLLTASLLTFAFAAEPSATKPTIDSSPHPAAAMLTPALQKALDTPVSFSFEEAPMKELATWLGKTSTAIEVDPMVVASDRRISFKGSNIKLKDALTFIERIGGIKHMIVDGKTYLLVMPLNPMHTKAGHDIRKIALAAMAYENNHDERWPADFAELKQWSNGELDDKLFQCTDHPEILQPFLYIRPSSSAKAVQPVIIQDPACNRGQGSMVCYADGHVSYEMGALATAMWEEARRLATLPKAKNGGIETNDWTSPPDIKAQP